MRRILVVMIVLVVLVAAATGGVLLWHRETACKAQAEAAPPPVPVVAGTVTQHDVPIYLSGTGTVIAYNTVVVRSQIQGQVVSINFTEGQSVHAGDLLAQIDPRPYQAQLEQLTANRDRDQANLNNAQADLDRYNTLQHQGFASAQLQQTQKSQVAQLQSAVKSDQALIDSANLQLGYTRLTTPINGVTGIRQVDIGNIIHPGDANGLVVVTQVQPISLIFTLPETTLPQIQAQQQRVGASLAVSAFTQDGKTEIAEGKLTLIDNEILQTTGSIRLKAEFPNEDRRLWPGELVNVRLLVDTRHDGLTVPASVVQQGSQGGFAYVIGQDGSVAVRQVKVAQIQAGQALIDSGLSADERVVVDGQYKLQPGVHVTLLQGKAADEAKAQSALQATIP